MSESPAKRQRSDNGCGMDMKEKTTRSGEFWFSDGNVVLEAEGTQFLVHKSVLSRHFDVFKGMFEIPQPPIGPTLDGYPLVHLSDRAQDVQHVLCAFYDCILTTEIPLPIFAAIVRLGHKYEGMQKQHEVAEILMYEFPVKKDEYYRRAAYTKFDLVDTCELLDLLSVSYEVTLQTIIPSLYLELFSTYDLETIIMLGATRIDGSSLHISTDLKLIWASALSKLRQKFKEYTITTTKTIRSRTCRQCQFNTAANHIELSILRAATATHFDLRGNSWKSEWEEYLCITCKPIIRREYEEGLEKLWLELPSFFGLPGWNDLKKFG